MAERPTEPSRALTWDLAHQSSDRHMPSIRAALAAAVVTCRECGDQWPCGPREAADDTMRLMEEADAGVAEWLPGADYALAAAAVHTPR
jgi:hypothetical protein